MLEAVIPLGFFNQNKQSIHHMCMILSKALDPSKAKFIYDDQSATATLADLTVSMLKSWVDDYADTDSYVLGSVVDLLEVLLHSQRVWASLKQQPVISAKLLHISKRPQLNPYLKTKIVALVSLASKPQFNDSIIHPRGGH
jgi:hypothetical protein